MEDEQLITLLEQRSERALTELNTQYGKLCRHVAYQVLASAEDAEECVDDTWLAVWNTIPPQRPRFLRAYVCRIVRNLAIKRYHSKTAAKRFSPYTVALDELAEVLEGAQTVEDANDEQVLTNVLTTFLDGLPQEDRLLFMRRYWFADTEQELAQRFGRSRGTIAVRLHRLRGKLRRELEKEGILI